MYSAGNGGVGLIPHQYGIARMCCVSMRCAAVVPRSCPVCGLRYGSSSFTHISVTVLGVRGWVRGWLMIDGGYLALRSLIPAGTTILYHRVLAYKDTYSLIRQSPTYLFLCNQHLWPCGGILWRKHNLRAQLTSPLFILPPLPIRGTTWLQVDLAVHLHCPTRRKNRISFDDGAEVVNPRNRRRGRLMAITNYHPDPVCSHSVCFHPLPECMCS